MTGAFRDRYGPWALIAGASEGIGESFAGELASRGLNLLLIARRQGPLEELAAKLRGQGVEVRTAPMDLGDSNLKERLESLTQGVEVGLVVYNAAYSLIGEFLEQSLEQKLKIVDVNVRGPMIVADLFGRQMSSRKRGGLLFMTSMAGFQGSPLIVAYSSTKAFNQVLAEGLWDELRGRGVDVVACCAGATRTPGFLRSAPRGGPAPMDPADVAREGLAALGRKPSVVAGSFNRFALFLMTRVFPRKLAVTIMGSQSRKMYGRIPP